MLLSASLAFMAIGIVGAGATVVFKRGGAITGLLVFAMTFVSGALFPTSLLPDRLQAIGEVMPTRFAFDGLRAALYDNGGWAGRRAGADRHGRCRGPVVGVGLRARTGARQALRHARAVLTASELLLAEPGATRGSLAGDALSSRRGASSRPPPAIRLHDGHSVPRRA